MSADAVVIVSGGMDSVTLLHHLVKNEGHQPAVISFDYGQKHRQELGFARGHVAELNCPTHQVIDLAPLQNLFAGSALVDASVAVPDYAPADEPLQPVTYVPNRNMIFLALAVALAESLGVADVYYGAQRHDLYGYWDTTPDFLARLNSVYALNAASPVQIHAPFVHYSKADILRAGLALSVDYGRTWSCYRGEALACGTCSTCAERLAAFREVGLRDPLSYR